MRLRARSRTVNLDRLLLGGQAGNSSGAFAKDSGQLLWGSTPVAKGPHAELFELLARGEVDLADKGAVLSTSYAAHALKCMDLYGHYLGATSADQVVDLVREMASGVDARRAGRTSPDRVADRHPRVRRIRHSECYEVVDGHHRLGRAVASGSTSVTVGVEWQRAETPLQALLAEMSWLSGKRQLYQPISAPELDSSWPIVRACVDRWGMMRDFLCSSGLAPPSSRTALDVASSYGWFVARYVEFGLDSEGIERDPLAVPLGQAAYGLAPGAIMTFDAIDALRSFGRTWDIVSCFSLLHHLALGLSPVGPDELLRLLDAATDRVLFLDTGQAHEAWFRETLTEWTDEGVEEQLRAHTSFSEIHRLGRDADSTGSFAGNYGRTLFACTRSSRSQRSKTCPASALRGSPG